MVFCNLVASHTLAVRVLRPNREQRKLDAQMYFFSHMRLPEYGRSRPVPHLQDAANQHRFCDLCSHRNNDGSSTVLPIRFLSSEHLLARRDSLLSKSMEDSCQPSSFKAAMFLLRHPFHSSSRPLTFEFQVSERHLPASRRLWISGFVVGQSESTSSPNQMNEVGDEFKNLGQLHFSRFWGSKSPS